MANRKISVKEIIDQLESRKKLADEDRVAKEILTCCNQYIKTFLRRYSRDGLHRKVS